MSKKNIESKIKCKLCSLTIFRMKNSNRHRKTVHGLKNKYH